jgi:hypothetical protein
VRHSASATSASRSSGGPATSCATSSPAGRTRKAPARASRATGRGTEKRSASHTSSSASTCVRSRATGCQPALLIPAVELAFG